MHLGAKNFDNFLGELWLGVHEGAFLFELPSGSITYTQEGTERRGPWHPDECSRCLLTWFDHGWINAYVLSEHLDRWTPGDDALLPDPDDETSRLLDRARARAILAAPQTWTNDSAEGFLILNPSHHAPDSSFRQLWLDAVTPA